MEGRGILCHDGRYLGYFKSYSPVRCLTTSVCALEVTNIVYEFVVTGLHVRREPGQKKTSPTQLS